MINQARLPKILMLFILLGALFSSCSILNSDWSSSNDNATEQKMNNVLSTGELPSVQIVVIDDNQIVWSKSFGEHTSPDFPYMNGSVQKVFDAAAILQLFERGEVDLDAEIDNYIPFQIEHPAYPEIPITLRMLLSHRSGLDAFDYQFSWDTECLFYPEFRSVCNPELVDLSLEEFLIASFTPGGSNYNPQVWIDKPGGKYHYSVSAYPLLRYVIEEVSGESYPDYMRENIFKPLEMLNTGFNSQDFTDQHAIPFTRVDGKNIELPVWNGNGYLMRTTAKDMAKFMLALMNQGFYNSFQLLQPESIQLMRANNSRGRSILNPDSELTDAGYGLGLIDYGRGWFGHSGSTVGYQSLWQFNPGQQSGFIILTNINGILGDQDDFQSVWQNVRAIRDVLQTRLDPLSAFDFPTWSLAILLGALIAISIQITRRFILNRKRT